MPSPPISGALGELGGQPGQFILGERFNENPAGPTQATISLVKVVVGGTGMAINWTLFASGPTPLSGVGGVAPTSVLPGSYILSESAGPANYSPSVWVLTGGGTLLGNVLTVAAGQTAILTITNTFVAPPPPSTIDIYIVRDYKFVFEPMPADIVNFTPWSNLSWPYEKTARNLILTIDTGGVPCSIAIQADGTTVQTVVVTSKSNDRDRIIALNPNLTGKMWRLVLVPGFNGKAQLFAAALDHIREPGGITLYDSLEQIFDFVGYKVMRQMWASYKSSAPITLTFLVDGGATFYSVTLPAHPNRDVERFFFPVANAGVLGKSKKIRIQITSSAIFFLYADSTIEFIPIGEDQRRSFAITRTQPEEQQPVASPTLGQWNALSSLGSAGRSVSR